MNPNLGLPFNQLGTLASHHSSRSFESIFYYLRRYQHSYLLVTNFNMLIAFIFSYSIKSLKVFPGAEPNLKSLLARLSTNKDKLTSSFSQLILKLVFPGKEKNSSDISQVGIIANFSSKIKRLPINNLFFFSFVRLR